MKVVVLRVKLPRFRRCYVLLRDMCRQRAFGGRLRHGRIALFRDFFGDSGVRIAPRLITNESVSDDTDKS